MRSDFYIWAMTASGAVVAWLHVAGIDAWDWITVGVWLTAALIPASFNVWQYTVTPLWRAHTLPERFIREQAALDRARKERESE